MSRQSGITTGAGLVFISETTRFMSALPGAFIDATATVDGVGQMDGAAVMAATGGLIVSGQAQMDGVASVDAAGSIIIFGVAHMDGVASVAAVGTTTGLHMGVGEMDGQASMAATGKTTVTVTGQMDGQAQVNVTGAMTVDITGQMDGRADMVAAWPLGSAAGYMDGVGDLEVTGSLILPPPIVMGLQDGINLHQVSTVPILTYHLYMFQNMRGTDIAKVVLRFKRLLTQNINLYDAIICKWVLTSRETIRLHASMLTHTSYKYNLIDHVGVRPTPLPFWNAILNLVQGFAVSQTTAEKFIWGRGLKEIIKVSSVVNALGTYKKSLAQTFKFTQVFNISRAIIMNQGINLTSSGVLGVSLKLLQKILTASMPSPTLNYHLKLAAEVVIEDIIGHYHYADMLLAQAFTIHPALDRQYIADGSMAELLQLSPILHNRLILKLTGNIQLSPEQLVHAIYAGDELLDGVTIQALYISPSGTTTTWAVNTRTNAVTEYLNYNFHSFTTMGNKYIAAGAEGLYELDGDTDDGASIVAELMSGYLQLNDKKLFGIKGAYVAIRGGGRFYLKLISGDGREYVYELRAQPNLMTTKVKIGKGISTTYVAFDLITEGQDFDLDSLEFIPMVRGRRV